MWEGVGQVTVPFFFPLVINFLIIIDFIIFVLILFC